MSGRLEGKVALITGGASGMGLATAELFIGEGASVVVADIDEARGRELEAAHGKALRFVRCDVTVEHDIVAAVGVARSAFGGLDILFNNAGNPGPPVDVLDMTGELWDRLMALQVRGPMFGIKHAAAAMRERGGGAIVNTASVAALEYGWGPIAYSTGKAALLHLTRCAAGELAKLNIRVNAICPGVIATEIFAKYLGVTGQAAENVRDVVIRNGVDVQPLRRTGLPEDIARACLYLASDDSRFVTGTHVVVDGGLTVGPRHAWDPTSPAPAERMGFTPQNVEKLMAGEMPS
jgi:NAD(P)-dependent dehydrogenase (short-subunit alcohol dehydrogenase family)